jgi:prenyltransferase beta subunit
MRESRGPRSRSRIAVGLAALALAAAALLGGGNGAGAEGPAAASLDRSVRFLQDAQNRDGGFGGVKGGESDPLFSAWVALALAAAGVNPQDQSQPGGNDALTYLTARTTALRQTTDFDRAALVALAAGTSPNAFGAADPVGTILARQLPDGSFAQAPGIAGGWVNSTVWSILPLSAVGTPEAEAAVGEAAEWLVRQQKTDGSWGATSPGSETDTDMTAAAVEALRAADLQGVEAEAKALAYLRRMQGSDGGFRETDSGPTNSATTAWTIQALVAAGIAPSSWRTDSGADPLTFLASLQRADGSIGWTAASDANSLWMTAQAGPALAGRAYPLPPVPRRAPAPRRQPPPAQVAGERVPRATRHGHGGRGVVHGDGVIAGGGGAGARLFSAPQPQSGGSEPGGPRRTIAAAAPGESSRGGKLPGQLATAGRIQNRTPRAGGRSGGQRVEGPLIGEGVHHLAAPGLFAADRGGSGVGLGGALAAAVLAAAVAGWRRERVLA